LFLSSSQQCVGNVSRLGKIKSTKQMLMEKLDEVRPIKMEPKDEKEQRQN
jgi:hypothetical protein